MISGDERKYGYNHGRIDFVTETELCKKTGLIKVRLRPDPRRHVEIVEDGKLLYLDRYLNTAVSLEEIVEQMGGLPLFASPVTIESAPDYAAQRRLAVEQELETGQYVPPSEKAKPHESFGDNLNTRDIVFLSVDIVGSTPSRNRDPQSFDKGYKIFLQELGTIAGQFHGTILKPTGDGFIAYVDFPAFTTQCDSAVDLGLSFLVVLHDAVNPALAVRGIEPIRIRVGADFGPARVERLTVPATAFVQTEVISDALNRSVKIEQSCDPNRFRIGFELYRRVHVQWLERARQVKFDGGIVGMPGYPVFEMD